MKVLVFGILASSSLAGFAADDDFAAHKQKRLENMDKMIAQMQESRTCVSAATNKDEMKKCKEKMKEHMKGRREERKAKKSS